MQVTVTDYEGNETQHDIGSEPLTVICHQQGMRVSAEVPTITPEDTIACIRSMSEKEWKFVSGGGPFQYIWQKLYGDPRHENGLRSNIPKTLAMLSKLDMGVQHSAGLIICLLTEVMIKGSPKVFVQYPETYMHPSEQRYIVDAIQSMMRFKPATKLTRENADQDYVRSNYESDAIAATQWLGMHEPEKRIGNRDGQPITAEQGIAFIKSGCKTGRALVAQYVQLRDG